MALPTLPVTLTNGTANDADPVMSNFNALLNGITDTTKDISINAATLAGTLAVTGASTFTGAVTANGNVTFGNATTDTTTVTGELLGSRAIISMNSGVGAGQATSGYIGTGTNPQTGRLSFPLPRAGSVVGMSLLVRVGGTVTSGGTITGEVRINDVAVLTLGAITVAAIDTDHVETTTQVRDADSFSADDLLEIYLTFAGGLNATLGYGATVELQFDT